ncbi:MULTISPECIES: 2-succinyl-5-enolpyruvyl-6-hydroxy-3-cyclohexene-1-carboxylic-acid synthase [Actinomadura]|uniref:2-succinyl-5-enolpyruvyl-6-hydroxy-3-cyclohexene-1-carboxylate synthase n=1 Tax=Actinomadura litoris TaxID=2678616 RepID=A0A7K1KYJ7_9ACTN|nr:MULTISPECIES: 2-succinyl-5-enolpyruvyl-6-hydroxy-3-cyclohexene-1-carboxylic-acid synthase [Actinomadura]MBT2212216.1 2-succinyl-5-enolpyruvyl-6-hydroxy-3-cyclohexene-1-carboxylic-acid synthase [Actinomadura sp. NEAU-AAG7]MUN37292.1 2-succinyl-5-enolpyruvyl-6-hydroxy-3-cyclohexene-1-carboxylic-acid synthase [Actinomadura litoris]
MNPATALATVLVDELLRCGMTDAVLAPGSRSAPLALALHAAEEAGRVRLHVRIDERSASFLGLGMAKRAGRPVALVCTSGTAAANFHPAVIEAHESGVPLLVITADRPPELRDTGANQTIDQVKLYGTAARWSTEVGAPENRPGMVAYWRSLVSRAWGLAQAPVPGPVHLNAAFREPLIPDGDETWCEPLDGDATGAWTKVRAATPGSVLHVPPTRRGVLVVGDGAVNVKRYVAAASMAGWPVLAEPNGNARYGDHALSSHHFLLGVPEFVERHRPEVVVTLGKPGLSRPLLSLLRRAEEHIVLAPDLAHWPDPVRSATQVAPEVEIPVVSGDDAWLKSWRAADLAAAAAVDGVLDAVPEVSEPRLARDLVAALPGGSLLFSAASMPIRDLDQVMRPRRGIRVMANRGASGIDGLVSTAMGAALLHSGRSYALLGDLAFLHDQNGLIVGPQDRRPDLAIVVVNNQGGGIFSLLPQAALHGPFERVFGTPHRVDLEAVAAAHGLPYRRLELAADLPKAIAGEGLRIVEARTDREVNAALHGQMRKAAHAAVRALLAS